MSEEFYIFSLRYRGQTQYCISLKEKKEIDRLFEKVKKQFSLFPELAKKMYYVEGLEKLKRDIGEMNAGTVVYD